MFESNAVAAFIVVILLAPGGILDMPKVGQKMCVVYFNAF